MKPPFFIIMAIVVGVAFAGMILWQGSLLDDHADVELAGSNTSSSEEAGSLSPVPHESPSVDTVASVAPTPPATNHVLEWGRLESEDYRQYLQNLRNAGCPEQTVRDIVTADLLKAYHARRAEVMKERYRNFEYWKCDPQDALVRAEAERKWRLVDEEMNWALRELLGAGVLPPSTAQEWKTAELDQQLGFLDESKRQAVRDLLLENLETEAKIKALADSQPLNENIEEREISIAAWDRLRGTLHRLVTPAEFERIELSTSWTAENLRRGMASFHPTETEFRQLFREWRNYDDMLARLNAAGQPDPGNLDGPLKEKINDVLGPERAAEYWATWWK